MSSEADRLANRIKELYGKPFTKTAQVRMVGNSVSPPPAIALVLANVGEVKRIEAA